MKAFLWTFVAVFAGIWVYSRWTAKGKPMPGASTSYGAYAGPEIDPLTGNYNPPGYGAGTVSTTAGGIGAGDMFSNGGKV